MQDQDPTPFTPPRKRSGWFYVAVWAVVGVPCLVLPLAGTTAAIVGITAAIGWAWFLARAYND